MALVFQLLIKASVLNLLSNYICFKTIKKLKIEGLEKISTFNFFNFKTFNYP